jgi:uncharacterized protein (TIGR02145 family)
MTTNPTIANNKTIDGVGDGSFTSNLTGLGSATTYYVKAYATNAYGTSYGTEISFTTALPAPPTITSFTPASGPVGTTVTITGTNFSMVAANTVWFGAVKATVTSTSPTQLVVTVPLGASYQPISVLNTATGFTAYSSAPFNVTFPSTRILDGTAFEAVVDFSTGTATNPDNIAIRDIDGDGKPDLAVTNYTSSTVSVFRNTSTSGSITTGSFAAKVDFSTGQNPACVKIGDIDGDGKPDMVIVSGGDSTISVFKNTSVAGSITTGSFAAKIDFKSGNNPFTVEIGDIDGDGKPDLIVSNSGDNTISILRNKGVTGSVSVSSFASRVNFTTGAGPRGIAFGDIDGDGKPDLAVTNNGGTTVSVFRNSSTPGSITTGSLATSVDLTVGSNSNGIGMGDIDGDGKPDLAAVNWGSNSISVLRNVSASGSITSGSFNAKVDFTTGSNPRYLSFGDLDGDGKPDLVVTNEVSNSVSVFRNSSTSGSITSVSFATRVDLATGTNPWGIAIGDMDCDGKPDIAAGNYAGNSVSVFRNKILNSGLVAYYPFSGSTIDESGNANNGTPNVALTYASDRFGNANKSVTFTTSPQYIVVPNSSSFPTTAISFSYWFNRQGNAIISDEAYLVKNMAFQSFARQSNSQFASGVFLGVGGSWQNFFSNQSLSGNTTWHHYAFTYENSTKIAKTFMDGVLVSTETATDPNAIIKTTTESLMIGGGVGLQNISGSLDDIRIYNRSLNLVEIDSLYHEGGWDTVFVSNNCVNKFADGFNIDISHWNNPTAQGSWTVTGGKLIGNYGIGCGSTTCPQADLILNDAFQISNNWKATASFNKFYSYTYGGDAYASWVDFSLWNSSSSKMALLIGEGGVGFPGGLQDSVIISLQKWNGSWVYQPIPGTSSTGRVKYPAGSWNADGLNSVTLQKSDSIYKIFFNDVYISQFTSAFLTNPCKIGFHSYGGTEVESFQVDSCTIIDVPRLTTTLPTAIWAVSATSGGNILHNGGATLTSRGICWSTIANPTTADSKTIDGTGIGSFTSSLTGLSANTLYYVRAYATNSVGTAYGNELSFTTTTPSGTPVTDADGNIYNTVTIGTQIWMAENLKTTKYNDGSAIPLVTDNTAWTALTTPGYCWYNNDEATSKASYGALYNWYSINTGKLCPTDWHVSSDAEWKTLEMYLGMSQAQADSIGWRGTDQGAQLKNNTGWNFGGNGTNTSGFSALPWGNRDYDGTYHNVDNYGIWWSSTEFDTSFVWNRDIYIGYASVYRGHYNKQLGFSVRCLKNQTTTDTSLIAYYPFNGNANDSSANGNNGTLYGATLTTDRFGNGGKAYNFNGVDNKIEIADASAFNSSNQITVSTWANVVGTWTSDSKYIFDKSNSPIAGIGLVFDQNDAVYGIGNYAAVFFVGTSTERISLFHVLTPSKINGWKNVVGVIDQSTAKLYVDGLEVASKPMTGTFLPSSSPINIGATTHRSDQKFPGSIDDIRFYNRTLSASLIDSLYHEGGWPQTASITDTAGNTYKTVQIGTQTWMAENLKTTKYNDGSAIPLVTDNVAWAALTTPGFAWYNNDSVTNSATYGALYNWYSVNTGKLCPTGWHIPSDAEWSVLTAYLGEQSAGGKLKELAYSHWNIPNAGATNETRFTAVPGGYRDLGGTFWYQADAGYWWSSVESNISRAWGRAIYYHSVPVSRGDEYKQGGLSIRCLKDSAFTIVISTLSTQSLSSISSTTAATGGNISSDGGATITARGVCWSTTANPTTTDSKTIDGVGIGSFTSSLTGLSANTIYYVRAYATNSVGTAYGNEISFTTASYGTPVTDADGNIYNTVTIGTQTWMAENLKTTKYNDGSTIPLVTDNAAWAALTTPGYSWYNNDSVSYSATYGALYNWYSLNTGILCPTGWHVPIDNEWKTLEMYLGLTQAEADTTGWRGTEQGTQLKNTSGWNSGGNGTNNIGFSALPGGLRYSFGSFWDGGSKGHWWSSTEFDASYAWNRSIYYGYGNVFRLNYEKQNGFSVRCLKDTAITMVLPTLSTQGITSILLTTAATGGNIISNGGATITVRGVCWSTFTNPTITDSKTTDGTGAGIFSSSITGLTAGTVYYVRAYATNNAGTSYGSEISFTTLADPPVSGTAASNSTICAGATATITLTGFLGSIQWEQSTDGSTNWINVANGTGANSAVYTTGNLTSTMYYRAAVSQTGYSTVYSNVIVVAVNPLPTAAGVITGLTTVCQGQSSVSYTVPSITDASSYLWTLPTGATGSSTTNTITVNYGASAVSGNVTVKGNNTCGDGTISTLAITVNPLPSAAGVITGLSTVCQAQSSVSYTVPTITDASSYIWTLPTGASGTSTTNSITVNYSASSVSGNITVKGNNSCGDGAISTLAITVNPLPTAAGVITGLTTVCQGQSSVSYTVPSITDASSYVWTLPNGASGTSTTNSITVNYSASAVSGNVTVKGNNSCGDGAISTLAITVNPLPANAGSITGLTAICKVQNSVAYSVPSITNATSYIWTLPSGATGSSATNSISVNFDTSAVSGNITVKGSNSCGDGGISTLPIAVSSIPGSAGSISGPATVCQGQNLVSFSIPAIPNAASYIWSLPTGITGTSTTNNITISIGASAISGIITVKGTNSCGDGAVSSLAITVNSLPGSAGTISGTSSVCQSQTGILYAVPTISNATSYVWTLPSGVTGTSATKNILVAFDTSAVSGGIEVNGLNSCGSGSASIIAVTVSPLPKAAGAISGLSTVCQGQSAVSYTVPVIANATSYIWTLPGGATGTSTTNSIFVDYGKTAVSGSITVKGSRSCGDGAASVLPVTVNTKPTAPIITINGNLLHSNILMGNQWYDQSGIIPGASNQNYMATSNGDYYAIASLQGCSSDPSNSISKFFLCDAQFDYSWNGFASFTDMSNGNPTAWSWNFGDGSYSTLKSPTHNYTRNGTYMVSLTIYNLQTNCVATVTKEITAGLEIACQADFDAVINSANGLTSFTSKSLKGTDYYWDFGDAEYSIEVNPQHTFAKAGFYKVCLTVWNDSTGCQSTLCKDVMYIPTGVKFIQADFSFFTNPVDNSIIFNDLSTTNTTNWYWTMGDGKVNTTQNPVYTYSKPGTYNVCLTAFDNTNSLSQSVCKEVRVGDIVCSIGSEFTYFIDPAVRDVSFFNLSTGSVDSYFWTFGDGNSSTLENPGHQYEAPGYYEVELSVRNSTSKCMDEYSQMIQVGSTDCRANYTFRVNPANSTVNFTDDSKGAIEYYYWDFGDGSNSVLPSPEHIYKKAGIYMVGQTVIDNTNDCVDNFIQLVQVGSVDCSADFVSYIDSSNYTAYFTNRILGESTALLWSFGDGRFSTQENPIHVFPGQGIYSVGLNTYDLVTGCMEYYDEMLLIGGLGIDCEADFVYLVDPVTSEVTFSNKSIGDNLESIWNFGDLSDNSLETNPVHTFTKGGYFNVCLTVTNSSGIRNMGCKWILIQATAANDCRSNFMFTIDSTNLKVKFVDNSFGNIDKYSWDFGDSKSDSVSILKDPVHTYSKKGFYLVQLKVENSASGCLSSEYKLLNVADNQILKAAFGYEAKVPDKKFTGYPVDLVSASSGDGATVEWDFGDKQLKKDFFTVMDSTSRIVTHYYQKPGMYNVCLRISDPVTGYYDVYCSHVFTKNAVGTDDVNESAVNLSIYPNPFIDNTTIEYSLSTPQFVEIAIYDQLGRRIETLVKTRKDAGDHQIVWETKGLTTGIYHLKLIGEEGIITRQMVVTK